MNKKIFIFFTILLLMAGSLFSCHENGNDMSNIDFSNIKALFSQPLPVLQKAVQGKWKWCESYEWSVGYRCIYNTFVEINDNHVIIDYADGSQKTIYFTWEKRYSSFYNCDTYIMCEIGSNKELWSFTCIIDDILYIAAPLKDDSDAFDLYNFARIKNETTGIFDNPLTDLPWLKEYVNLMTENVKTGKIFNARIFQCTYNDGIGFLLEECMGCPDSGYSLHDYEGKKLCYIDYESGNSCKNFYIIKTKLIFEANPICNFDNPLTDLPWLKEITFTMKENLKAGNVPNARIYQCTYKYGTGFLLEECVGCTDSGYSLHDCKGKWLCSTDYEAGDSFENFNVDFKNKLLIFEAKTICNCDNPLTNLLWLKKYVNGMMANYISGYLFNGRIYQCTYKDSSGKEISGFLMEDCMDCFVSGYSLHDCEGKRLCCIGCKSENTCINFSVDFENKILIFEANRGIKHFYNFIL